jgi:hypothetical protein
MNDDSDDSAKKLVQKNAKVKRYHFEKKILSTKQSVLPLIERHTS